MKQATRIISIYSSDTAGVSSMMYELGGMTVIHDASGCNSTYSTHDEPRWYQMDSMVYISGVTETDIILGNDERLVKDVVKTAKSLSPRFITLAASPMPVMTGTDLDAIGEEIHKETSLPVFPIHTNGMDCYLKGASEALLACLKYFCREEKKSGELSLNILGATPLDLSINGTVERLKKYLEEEGFKIISCMSMGSTLDEISFAGKAQVNLVVSSCGLAAAEYLKERFSTPFVTGLPLGRKFAKLLVQELKKAAKTGESIYGCLQRSIPEKRENAPCIIHESIFGSSLACALEEEYKIASNVILPSVLTPSLHRKGEDILAECEDHLTEIFTQTKAVIADPMYQAIAPENIPFISLPHEAFSGRCFRRENKNLIAGEFLEWRNILC